MSLDTERFATEISDALATTGENYTVKALNLDNYGTSCEITRHDSDRRLHLTPIEDSLIDMILFDGKGNTLAACTLFDKNDLNITTEELTNLITLCF
nr:MAG: hypothetical protein [Bacteriophage sp.]